MKGFRDGSFCLVEGGDHRWIHGGFELGKVMKRLFVLRTHAHIKDFYRRRVIYS
jgi:hypothetical protein